MNNDRWKYFKYSDFECPCCGLNSISTFIVDTLDEIRREGYTAPIYINSGTRCQTHNEKVKGIIGSSHLYGLAADASVSNSNDRFSLVKRLLEKGIRQIGIYENFIHLGIDPEKPYSLFRGKY